MTRLGKACHQRLESHQTSERERALDHAQAADAEYRGNGQSGEQRRQHFEKDRGCSQFLLGIQRLCLNAGPLTESLVLQPARLEGFDRAHGAHRGADKLAPFERETAAEILPALADQSQRQHVQQRHADADRRERNIVDRHRGGKKHDRCQIERVGGDAARKQAGNLFVGGHAACNVAGMALGEEFDRQRHDVPEKPADHDHRKLGLQPQQAAIGAAWSEWRGTRRSRPCRSAAG